MAAPKRPTHIVTHNNFYFAAAQGKPQHIKKGSALTLNEKQAANLSLFVSAIDKESIDLSENNTVEKA